MAWHGASPVPAPRMPRPAPPPNLGKKWSLDDAFLPKNRSETPAPPNSGKKWSLHDAFSPKNGFQHYERTS